MRVPRSVLVLRLCCLLALLASAALTADALQTGRRFCPLDAACEKARASELGTILGVKTSVLGIAAFGALLLVTLLPARLARVLGRPAAWLAGVGGLGFVVYQGLILGGFCPLCLVADLAGLGAAAAAMAWPRPPLQRSKRRRLPTESGAARLGWVLFAHVVVAVPLLWPKPAPAPAWVELPEETRLAIDVASEFAPFLAVLPPDVRPPDVRPPPSGDDLGPHDAASSLPPEPDDDAVPGPPTAALPPAPAPAPSPARPVVPPAGVRAPAPSVAAPRAVAPALPAPRDAAREVTVVEYLNAYCAHCRATHARLDQVVASFPHPVRRQRVYVWSGKEVPLWARACAVAATVGREDAMFLALLETTRQDDRSVRAAAARAGVELDAGDTPEVVARLERDRRLFLAARLEGLPTFDVGRRRLMGEQSAAELRAALDAAVR